MGRRCVPGSRLAELAETYGRAAGFASDDWSSTDLTEFGALLLYDFVRRSRVLKPMTLRALKNLAQAYIDARHTNLREKGQRR